MLHAALYLVLCLSHLTHSVPLGQHPILHACLPWVQVSAYALLAGLYLSEASRTRKHRSQQRA